MISRQLYTLSAHIAYGLPWAFLIVEVEKGAAIWVMLFEGFQIMDCNWAGLCTRRTALEARRDTDLGAWRVKDRKDSILNMICVFELWM